MVEKNYYFNEVRKFQKAYNQPAPCKPTILTKKQAVNRSVWTGEEIVELLYATAKNDKIKFKEMFDMLINGLDSAYNKIVNKNDNVDNVLIGQADALIDQLYFVIGSLVEMGVKPDNLFDIVQSANMGKLWEDGKPRFREGDGKIIKPPNWEEKYAPEPKIKQEIENQLLHQCQCNKN